MPKALWAPWRMQYLEDGPEEKIEGCLFCNLLEQDRDRDNLIAHREGGVAVILNKYPYNNGHVMVIPKLHVGNLIDLPESCLKEIVAMTKKVTQTLTDLYHPGGFNIGMNVGSAGGAGIPDHLHMHIVPRWAGDTNFMPVLADSKSMPEHLMNSFDRIHDHFSKKES